MQIKVKQTGVIWEIDETSPEATRIKEQPDDYEVIDEPKHKKGSK